MRVLPPLFMLTCLAASSHAGARDARTWAGWEDLPLAARQLSSPDCRVALVVGNGDYSHARNSKLRNARGDARAVAEVLATLGFRVVLGMDLDEAAFKDRVSEFVDQTQAGCASLVFYAGHAVQGASGRNFLLPVDMQKTDDPVLHAIDLQYLLARLREREAVVRLAFLDACRSLVWDGDRGPKSTTLAPVVDGTGLFVGFAAASGQVADDGPPGGHSPFTASFVKYVQSPGLRVEGVFDAIQADLASTRQSPQGHDHLAGDFYFLPPQPGVDPDDLAAAWAQVLALPEPLQLDAALAFLQQHAVVGGPQVELAVQWVANRVGAPAPRPPPASRPPDGPGGLPSTPREAGKRMISASGVPLRWIPPTGSEGFTMGTDPDSPGRYVDEGPVQAHLTEGLWVMEHEVTHAMFASMMNTVSHFDGGHRPVDSVTWCEAVLFANRLSAAEGLVPAYLGVEHWPVERCDEVAANGVELRADANGYRLLTEAEWEWSARAGAPTTYAGGDELEAVAWWMGNSDGGPAEVCTRDANAWGLCDMTGNVSEWVQDAYFATLTGGDDPLVMAGGDRVFRGGSWFVAENDLRVANRAWSQPGERWYDVGFRLGRSE